MINLQPVNILFLDIDGVLNHNDYYLSKEYETRHTTLKYPDYDLDPLAVGRINFLHDQTDCKIVLSSSWRFADDIKGILSRNGLKVPIVDVTPFLGFNVLRGREIDKWLHDTKATSETEIAHINYVIFDDDGDMLYHQKDHFVHIDMMHGVTDDDIQKAVNIFQGHGSPFINNKNNTNMQTVRAKFTCDAVESGQIVKLSAVYSDEGENKDFTDATPWGNIEMGIDEGVPASNFFETGKTYYVDFKVAPQ